MSLEIAIQENTKAVRELIAALGGKAGSCGSSCAPIPATTTPSAAPAPTEAPAKKQKEAVAVTEAADTQPTAAPTAAPAPKEESSGEKIERTTIETTFRKLAADKGREVAVALLAQFGINKLGELPEDKFAAFLKAAA